jgi:hypothetical protein
MIRIQNSNKYVTGNYNNSQEMMKNPNSGKKLYHCLEVVIISVVY